MVAGQVTILFTEATQPGEKTFIKPVSSLKAEAVTLPQGKPATATLRGTDSDPVFMFGLPAGAQGEPGKPGRDGSNVLPTEEAVKQIMGDSLGPMVVDEVDKLKPSIIQDAVTQAVGQAVDQADKNLDTRVPTLIDEKVPALIDDAVPTLVEKAVPDAIEAWDKHYPSGYASVRSWASVDGTVHNYFNTATERHVLIVHQTDLDIVWVATPNVLTPVTTTIRPASARSLRNVTYMPVGTRAVHGEAEWQFWADNKWHLIKDVGTGDVISGWGGTLTWSRSGDSVTVKAMVQRTERTFSRDAWAKADCATRLPASDVSANGDDKLTHQMAEFSQRISSDAGAYFGFVDDSGMLYLLPGWKTRDFPQWTFWVAQFSYMAAPVTA